LVCEKYWGYSFHIVFYPFRAQGLSNKQIAYQMNVSEATVKLHINALLRAVGATNRTQAVIKSQQMGIV
jgi:DNA-binding NarL/FixJ family response regulator